jgi:hypothetical protein
MEATWLRTKGEEGDRRGWRGLDARSGGQDAALVGKKWSREKIDENVTLCMRC